MTAGELLSWIGAALLLQLTAGIGLALRRHHGVVAIAPMPEAVPTGTASSADWAGWREFRVARREFEDAAHTQCSFYLEPVDGKALRAFRPGQFLTFSLAVAHSAAGEQGGSRPITRCYSLSDRPDAASYRVTIKRVAAPSEHPGVPAGLSSNHFHDHVREGDVLRVKAPSGHFFIDFDPSIPVVLVGGGIGITPLMCMLRWCLSEQPTRTIHLYYGLHNSRVHAFKRQLEAMAKSHPSLHLNVVYSRPGAEDERSRDYQHEGHIDVELLRRTLPHGRHRFYVCGPGPMMQTLVPALAGWGVAATDVRFEAFGPASVGLGGTFVPQTTLGTEVTFRRSGRTLTWDGTDASLLDFAERHGIEVDSGCRAGSCGTCETRLVSGEVHYANVPDHDMARGHCLLCVGTPASPLVLEA